MMKAKCCNQLFHIDRLDQWVKQEKSTCPMCINENNFMTSLPFQKLKLVLLKEPCPQATKQG